MGRRDGPRSARVASRRHRSSQRSIFIYLIDVRAQKEHTAALVAVAIETLTVGVVNVVGLTVFCVTGGLMTLVISHRPVEVLVKDRGRLGPQHSVRTPGGRCRSERRDGRE